MPTNAPSLPTSHIVFRVQVPPGSAASETTLPPLPSGGILRVRGDHACAELLTLAPPTTSPTLANGSTSAPTTSTATRSWTFNGHTVNYANGNYYCACDAARKPKDPTRTCEHIEMAMADTGPAFENMAVLLVELEKNGITAEVAQRLQRARQDAERFEKTRQHFAAYMAVLEQQLAAEPEGQDPGPVGGSGAAGPGR